MFQIKHKPTGLFYCPSRTVNNKDKSARVKSNLSVKGKVYRTSPSLGWIGGRIYTHLHTGNQNQYIDAPWTDWEIIENGKTPKRPEGVSDDEYAIQIGCTVVLNHVLMSGNDTMTVSIRPHQEEAAQKLLAEAFRLGLKATDDARKDFQLSGAL
jgi:hypothetical protein